MDPRIREKLDLLTVDDIIETRVVSRKMGRMILNEQQPGESAWSVIERMGWHPLVQSYPETRAWLQVLVEDGLSLANENIMAELMQASRGEANPGNVRQALAELLA